MHVNEQTVGSLRRALRDAGFARARLSFGQWVQTEFVPDQRARRTYSMLRRMPLLRRFGAFDIFAEATKS